MDCLNIVIMNSKNRGEGVREKKQSVMAYRLKCPRTANGGLSHYMFGDLSADKALF
jgi:hypothetical protein